MSKGGGSRSIVPNIITTVCKTDIRIRTLAEEG